MVSSVAKPWILVGQQPPLEQRWRTKLDELAKIAPGVSFGSPMTESTYADLAAMVAKIQAAKAAASAPSRDRYTQAAIDRWGAARRDRHSKWLTLRDLQKQLSRIERHEDVQILGLVTPDLYLCPSAISMSVDDAAIFTSATDADQATAELRADVDRMDTRCKVINEILAFKNADRETKNTRMISALWRRMQHEQNSRTA
jgi:hypothetical protein